MSLHQRFDHFHNLYPQVYDEIVRRAREEVAAGRRPGIRRIWEEVRAALGVRMNDHLHSAYAREIMAREADLAGVFRTRTSRKAASEEQRHV